MPTTSPRRPGAALPPLRLDPGPGNQALRVHAALRAAILDGLLPPGARLPSSRETAEQLGLGRNVIVAAFEHLTSDGLIEARPGSGTYVCARLPPPPAAPAPPQPPATHGRKPPFALGQTHVEPAFLSRLASATRRHVATASPDDLAYGDPRGSALLRQRIAAFLSAHRGIRCDPDSVVITAGTQHGLRLCADALLPRGTQVWFEDPGYGHSRTTLQAAGAVPVPVPVDSAGLSVADGIRRHPFATAACVTPSHQFPTGVRLTMERRVALIDWAETHNAWIFEDDYDSEFRYSGPPLTALAGLSPRRVIYLGTFAKTLFPGLRLGYLVIPPEALAPVLTARAAIDRFAPVFLQKAVADLIEDGTVARHLRRNLRLYRRQRDLLAEILTTRSQGVLRPEVPDHGLHMVVSLRPDLPPSLACAIRDDSGVEALLLSEARMLPGGPEGLVLGFSGHPAEALRDAAVRLAMAAARHASSRSTGGR